MLYEKEFRTLKDIHARLPDAQREIVEVLAALPPLAVVVYGAVLVPLGIIGIGGLLTLSVASTLATGAMMAQATGQLDVQKLAALPGRVWQALEKAFTSLDAASTPQPVAAAPAATTQAAPDATVITMQSPFNTAALRTVAAANDAPRKAPKPAAKGMATAK
ncbi:MAG: hypothetical protein IT560_07090 [Alphaproteobacteria bacterium]|nr:hypothetical protein [Alphaproteobacteria bacterium]